MPILTAFVDWFTEPAKKPILTAPDFCDVYPALSPIAIADCPCVKEPAKLYHRHHPSPMVEKLLKEIKDKVSSKPTPISDK